MRQTATKQMKTKRSTGRWAVWTAAFTLGLAAGCHEKTESKKHEGVITSKTMKSTAHGNDDIAGLTVTMSPPEVVKAHPYALEHSQPCRVNHLKRARDLRELGERKDAKLEVRKAAFDAPEDIEVLSLLAELSRTGKDRSMAAVVYGDLARIQPEDAGPLVQKARMLLSMKDLDAALETVNEALARDGEFPEAHHVKGRVFLESGKLSQAIAAFEETVSLQPDHGYAYNNLGLAYLRAHQNRDALEVLTLAADYLPDVAFVQNNLGVALERMGQRGEAEEAFARALDLSPRYVKAKVNVERLEKVARLQGWEELQESLDSTEDTSDLEPRNPDSLDSDVMP